VLRCERSLRNRSNDEVDLEPNELLREIGEPLELSLRPSGLDGDVLPHHPAQLAKPVAERCEEVLIRRSGAGRQPADAPDPARLRLRGRRSCDDRPRRDDQERPPIDQDASVAVPKPDRRRYAVTLMGSRKPMSAFHFFLYGIVFRPALPIAGPLLP
jgi:hypothetical protein